MRGRRNTVALVTILLILAGASAAFADLTVLDACYHPDRMLPNFNVFWTDSSYRPGDPVPSIAASGNLCIYVKNTGASSVTIDDVLLENVSMKQAMGCKTDKTYRDGLAYACSIYYPSSNPITSVERQTLIDHGEPVWYRIDPATVAPGATAEVFIRMRNRVDDTLSLTVVPTSGSSVPVTITVSDDEVPKVTAYSLSSDSTTLYLYLRHPARGTMPTQILVDGVDKTSTSTISGDSNFDIVPVVCNMGSALTRGTFHTFQAVYSGGAKASTGLRVYYDQFHYGRWGAPNLTTNQEKAAELASMATHSFTLQTMNAGSLGSYLQTNTGQQLMDQYGIWRVLESPGIPRVYSIYLCDEPDAAEDNVPTTVCPTSAQRGSMAQSLSDRGLGYKPGNPDKPTMVNLDGNNSPYDYYHYGNVADIFSHDPYYQARIYQSYWEAYSGDIHKVPIYSKATYIYAASSTAKAASEPRPLHIILWCVRHQDVDRVFRWATPDEKRIEAYYALAGGARQLDYWWCMENPLGQLNHNGPEADEPGAAALWREMGLIGAEAGMMGDIIVNSCPADVAITTPGKLWARALVSGQETMVIICVNDDYANTDIGTVIRPLKNATASLALPSWLSTPTDVFEVDYKGIHDVTNSVAGGQITLTLGTVNATRAIIITKNSSLKSTLQSLYNTKYGPRVEELIALP